MKRCFSLLFLVAISTSLWASDVIRVPDNKRVAKGDPPPPKVDVKYEKEGIDFPSVWNWKQFIARTNANFQYNGTKSIKNQGWLQTVQPFYTTSEALSNTAFIQFRTMFQNGTTTFNTGLSYRYLMNDEKYLFGINGFYDAYSRYAQQRWSLGGDFHTQWISIWGNYYDNVLRWRHTGNTGSNIIQRRVCPGGDFNASAPFPYLPWLRIEAGFYVWDYKNAKDASGYRIAGRAQIAGPLFIEGGRTEDRYQANNFVRLSLNLGFPNFMEYTLFNTPVSKTVLPARTLKRFILDPIRRYNNLRFQQRTTTSSGIIVGRS